MENLLWNCYINVVWPNPELANSVENNSLRIGFWVYNYATIRYMVEKYRLPFQFGTGSALSNAMVVSQRLVGVYKYVTEAESGFSTTIQTMPFRNRGYFKFRNYSIHDKIESPLTPKPMGSLLMFALQLLRT